MQLSCSNVLRKENTKKMRKRWKKQLEKSLELTGKALKGAAVDAIFG